MKYENAKDLLPEELLKVIQKYAAGKLLYMPSIEEKKNWGESSGYREKLRKRNQRICNMYANGRTISELADEYFLSLDSIKKIIYSKNKDRDLEYVPSLKSAVKYANTGMLEEWIHSFLLFTSNNREMSQELMEEEYIYFGVVKLPLRLVRTEGLTVANVDNLIESYGRNVSDMPPLIIRFVESKFYVAVQTDMFMALKQRKVNAYPTILVIHRDADYMTFMKNYDQCLLFVNSI